MDYTNSFNESPGHVQFTDFSIDTEERDFTLVYRIVRRYNNYQKIYGYGRQITWSE